MNRVWAAILATLAVASLTLALILLINSTTGSGESDSAEATAVSSNGPVAVNKSQSKELSQRPVPQIVLLYPNETQGEEQRPGVFSTHSSIDFRLHTDKCAVIQINPSNLYPEQNFPTFPQQQSVTWSDPAKCQTAHVFRLTNLQPDTNYLIEVKAKTVDFDENATQPTVLSARTESAPAVDVNNLVDSVRGKSASELADSLEANEEKRAEKVDSVFDGVYEFFDALYNWM